MAELPDFLASDVYINLGRQLLPDSTFRQLTKDEKCIVVRQDGGKRVGSWLPNEGDFHFSDGMEPTFIPLVEAYEWWPCQFNP